MRTISDRSAAVLNQQYGIEPILVIAIRWNSIVGWEFYADKTFDNIQGRIISVGTVQNGLNLNGSTASGSISLVLDDTDGKLKNYFNSIDIHKKPVRIYQYFNGMDIGDMFSIFEGQIASPITWSEQDRTFGFDVITITENQEVGFSADEGDFTNLPSEAIGVAWPLAFGMPFKQKGITFFKLPTLISIDPYGYVDYTLQAKLDSLQAQQTPYVNLQNYQSQIIAKAAANTTLTNLFNNSRTASANKGLNYANTQTALSAYDNKNIAYISDSQVNSNVQTGSVGMRVGTSIDLETLLAQTGSYVPIIKTDAGLTRDLAAQSNIQTIIDIEDFTDVRKMLIYAKIDWLRSKGHDADADVLSENILIRQPGAIQLLTEIDSPVDIPPVFSDPGASTSPPGVNLPAANYVLANNSANINQFNALNTDGIPFTISNTLFSTSSTDDPGQDAYDQEFCKSGNALKAEQARQQALATSTDGTITCVLNIPTIDFSWYDIADSPLPISFPATSSIVESTLVIDKVSGIILEPDPNSPDFQDYPDPINVGDGMDNPYGFTLDSKEPDIPLSFLGGVYSPNNVPPDDSSISAFNQGSGSEDNQQLVQLTKVLADQNNFLLKVRSDGVNVFDPDATAVANFPVGIPVQIRSGDSLFIGTFKNNFLSLIPIHDRYDYAGNGLYRITQYDGKVTLTDTINPVGFQLFNPGTVFTIDQDIAVDYIISIVPSTIINVWAYKSVNNVKTLTLVPNNYWTQLTIKYIDDVDPNQAITAEVIRLKRPLSLYLNDGWLDDDIYVDQISSVGRNLIDIIKYLITRYSTYGYDEDSFNIAETYLAYYPCDFVLTDKSDIIALLTDMCFQAQCAIWIRDNKFFIKFLFVAEKPVDHISEDDIVEGSITVTTTETEDLVTKYISTYKVNYAQDNPNIFTVKYNDDKYGLIESTIDFTIYQEYNSVVRSTMFWLIRNCETFKLISFKCLLSKIILEVFDTVSLNFQNNYIANGPVNAIVQSSTYDPSDNTVDITCWVPVRLGEMNQYIFAWPSNAISGEVFPLPDDSYIAAPSGYITPAIPELPAETAGLKTLTYTPDSVIESIPDIPPDLTPIDNDPPDYTPPDVPIVTPVNLTPININQPSTLGGSLGGLSSIGAGGAPSTPAKKKKKGSVTVPDDSPIQVDQPPANSNVGYYNDPNNPIFPEDNPDWTKNFTVRSNTPGSDWLADFPNRFSGDPTSTQAKQQSSQQESKSSENRAEKSQANQSENEAQLNANNSEISDYLNRDKDYARDPTKDTANKNLNKDDYDYNTLEHDAEGGSDNSNEEENQTGSNAFPGIVDGGSGNSYTVRITSPGSISTTVEAECIQIAEGETIPPGTGCVVVEIDGLYYFQVAVWM